MINGEFHLTIKNNKYKQMRQLLTFLILSMYYFFISAVQSQTISSKIVDQKTEEPIPYATVQVSEHNGLVTNEEGRFTLSLGQIPKGVDSLYISSVGYDKKGIALATLLDSIIYLQPKTIELSSVFVSNKKLSIDEILENIKQNLVHNYDRSLLHKKLFFRQSEFTDLHQVGVDFKKSTIQEFNEKFIDSVVHLVPKKSEYYTESLCDYYGDFTESKLAIIKGAELYDKKNDGSMETLSKKLEDILKKNVKPTSYLKIKSGWLPGVKMEMDSILANNEEAAEINEELKEEDKKEKNYFHKYRKSALQDIFSTLFFQEDSKLNFIDKSRKYDFEIVDYTIIQDEVVYVVNFEPKRGADFKGTIYVNTQDFAVVQVDYQNVKNLKNFKLLGFSYHDTLYKGKTIFEKGVNGKYYPKFIEKIRGNSFGVDRPLKIIEKNKIVKGRNKQNELSLGLDIGADAVSKYEVVIFDTQTLTENDFEQTKENKTIQPYYLSQYDPSFWEGHQIIEPNAAIKSFTALNE